jgi:hypothetical protein
VLLVLLSIEFLGIAALAVTLLLQTLTATGSSVPSGIALTIVGFIAAAWLGAIVVGTARGQAWIRAAAIVWQVLQVAVGVGALQGQVAQPEWGWPLIVLAALVVVLLFTKPVIQLTSVRQERS